MCFQFIPKDFSPQAAQAQYFWFFEISNYFSAPFIRV